jgi:hypothetical protein
MSSFFLLHSPPGGAIKRRAAERSARLRERRIFPTQLRPVARALFGSPAAHGIEISTKT